MLDDALQRGELPEEYPSIDDRGTIKLRHVRDLGDIINVTFRFIKENFRELGKGLLYILGPLVLVGSMLSYYAQSQMVDNLFDPASFDPNNPFEIYSDLFGSAYLVAILVGFLIQILFAAVVFTYVDLYRNGEAGTITPGYLWAETRSRTLTITGLTLLLGLFGILSALIMIIPCLGALAWIVGICYILPIVWLVYPSRLLDIDSIGESFSHTRELVRGSWTPAFGAALVAGLIAITIAAVFSIPSALVGFTSGLMSGTNTEPGGVSNVFMAAGVVLGYLGYVAYAIPLVASCFQYFSLAEKAEGTGLGFQVDMIGRKGQPADDVVSNPERKHETAPEERGSSSTSPTDSRSGFRGGGFDEPDTRFEDR